VTVPKGTGARHRLKLRPWQRQIIHGVLDEPRPRQALVSIPAGNGKSTLAAALGLYGLLADRVEGAQVLVIASDERQARIILNTARRMVELDPALSRHAAPGRPRPRGRRPVVLLQGVCGPGRVRPGR
jgi:phage terminase large subunit-like protein